MSRTIETTVFEYAELSDEAKSKACEWWRDASSSDNYFADSVYDDAADIADIIGIDLRTTRKQHQDGTHHYAPTISYSGFSSQDDGACFEGTYKYKPGALVALKKHIGGESKGDRELIRIATELQVIQKRYFYKITASMSHRGHYYHSGCMWVSVEHRDDMAIDCEDELTQLMRDFADWIYTRLESAYEYEQSDEYVIEAIVTNEYEFTENGEIV